LVLSDPPGRGFVTTLLGGGLGAGVGALGLGAGLGALFFGAAFGFGGGAFFVDFFGTSFLVFAGDFFNSA